MRSFWAIALVSVFLFTACEAGVEPTPSETVEQQDVTEEPATATATSRPRSSTATATSAPSPTATEKEAGGAESTATASLEPTNPPEPTSTPAPPEPTETPMPPPEPTATPDPRTSAQVLEVVDGDTLIVSIGGERHNVRLIGVDTPETVDPNEPVMCFGPEAAAFTREMVARAGNQVLLEKDVSESDRYGRLLRYVWLPHPDGVRFLNEELVRQGYAQASTYPPDVKYADLFVQRMREAREAGAGLWGGCSGFGVPAAQPEPTNAPAPPPPPPSSGNCHPSYTNACIPPAPPDLNCGDLPSSVKPVRVDHGVWDPDPHGLDGDGDGWGCDWG